MDREGAILGLDPGSRRTGFALVGFRGDEVISLEIGAWRTDGATRERALAQLVQRAEEWLSRREVAVAAVESLFHHKNARAALVLAEARGALLALLGRLGIEVAEYPPARVKQTICGDGRADKEQVRRALARTVPGLARFAIDRVSLDAADALAIAVTHHVHARGASLVGQAGRR